jgi:chaperone modulatory protein CbpM
VGDLSVKKHSTTKVTAVHCTVLDADVQLTLRELCELTGLDANTLIDMVDEGVIEPLGSSAHWLFQGPALERVHAAQRLQRELGVNLAGAALALDLLDELKRLRRTVERLKFHFPT